MFLRVLDEKLYDKIKIDKNGLVTFLQLAIHLRLRIVYLYRYGYVMIRVLNRSRRSRKVFIIPKTFMSNSRL